ncbi:MAG TPA: hypothetical protein VNL77_21260 [Roseiflexaceae bacterium]|nr:hypothetical protein [Roseiflexaceae bacterium]
MRTWPSSAARPADAATWPPAVAGLAATPGALASSSGVGVTYWVLLVGVV